MPLFAIAGASGHTGGVIADLLLAQGHRPRLIARDAARVQPLLDRGATLALADLADPVALAAALDGVDGAFLLLPPNMSSGDFRAYQRRVSASILEAVARARPRHVVLLSSIGAELPTGTGPIAGLHPLETGLRGIPEVGCSFVRAAYFMENLPGSFGMLEQGVFPTFIGADLAIPMIATRDIGEVAAGLLLEGAPSEGPRIVELGGAPTRARDVAHTLSELLGREIRVAELPVTRMAETLAGMGLPPDIAALYQEMSEAMVAGRIRFHGHGRAAPGRRSLRDFLAEAVGARA